MIHTVLSQFHPLQEDFITHSGDITLFMRKQTCKDLPDTVSHDGNS